MFSQFLRKCIARLDPKFLDSGRTCIFAYKDSENKKPTNSRLGHAFSIDKSRL